MIATCLIALSFSSVGRPMDTPTDMAQGIRAGTKSTRQGIEFVWIPSGRFFRGSETGDPDEKPVREIRISQGFWMGRFEVTKAQWVAVLRTRPWDGERYANPDPKSAASHISFENAEKFLRALEQKGGKGFRLPTEAEWEFACRAGSKSAYPFGDDAARLVDYAWYRANAMDKGQEREQAVGKKKPNAWGLYDMLGNTYEWCSDWYSEEFYRTGPAVDPRCDVPGRNHVVRGGAWFYDARGCRAANRVVYPVEGTDIARGGFRVVFQPAGG